MGSLVVLYEYKGDAFALFIDGGNVIIDSISIEFSSKNFGKYM
jgi:hypothetical protein